MLAREHDTRTASIAPSLTLFAVPRSGFTVTDRLQGVGMRSLETVTLQFDAHVPHGNLISRSGRGVHTIQWGLLHERLATAANMLGTATLALELATAHAERRVQFGAKLIRHQAVRMNLGRMASELWLAKAGVYALAGSLDKAALGDRPQRRGGQGDRGPAWPSGSSATACRCWAAAATWRT